MKIFFYAALFWLFGRTVQKSAFCVIARDVQVKMIMCYFLCFVFPEVVVWRWSVKRCFKNFAKFTGKHLFWSLFFINFQLLRPAPSLQRDYSTGVFVSLFAYRKAHFSTEQMVLLKML